MPRTAILKAVWRTKTENWRCLPLDGTPFMLNFTSTTMDESLSNLTMKSSVADQGEGPGGPGSRLIFRPKWGPKGWKFFFETPPYLRVWMTGPPPHPLNRYYNGTEYAGGVFNLKAGEVITLTAHYYPDIHGPKIYMDSKHSYFGALMI